MQAQKEGEERDPRSTLQPEPSVLSPPAPNDQAPEAAAWREPTGPRAR